MCPVVGHDVEICFSVLYFILGNSTKYEQRIVCMRAACRIGSYFHVSMCFSHLATRGQIKCLATIWQTTFLVQTSKFEDNLNLSTS